jgi:hypothetical protein
MNMKNIVQTISAVLITILLLSYSPKIMAQGLYDDEYNENYGASYQDFYDGLAPYGQWIYDQQFGYVWMPNVSSNFRPYYTNGYWAMTQFGNTWVSNYDWGWATFHYGRWTFDHYYGWLWIPGMEWAPAWVSWRSNYDYYGWAPMGPGVGINISLGSIPIDWWVFLSPSHFYEPRFHSYCSNWRYNNNIYRQTNFVSYTFNHRNSFFYTGPNANDFRRRTGRPVRMFNVNNYNQRGTRIRGNQINLYRPRMRTNEVDAPSRIVSTNRRISASAQSFNNGEKTAIGRANILNQKPIPNTNRSTQVGRSEKEEINIDLVKTFDQPL